MPLWRGSGAEGGWRCGEMPGERPSSPALLPSERGEGSMTWIRQQAPSPVSEGRVPTKWVAGVRACVRVRVALRSRFAAGIAMIQLLNLSR